MAYTRNNMELIIKFYTDKPSRVGIKYAYEFEAVKAYESLITKYRGETFVFSAEPLNNRVNIVMQSEQSGSRVVYKDLDYRPEQVKRLQALAGPGLNIQFVHIYSDANMLMVAKPFKRQEFLSITGFESVGSDSFR